VEGSSVASRLPKHEFKISRKDMVPTTTKRECWCSSGRLANHCSALYGACYGRLNEAHSYCEADEEDEHQSHDDLLLYETHKEVRLRRLKRPRLLRSELGNTKGYGLVVATTAGI